MKFLKLNAEPKVLQVQDIKMELIKKIKSFFKKEKPERIFTIGNEVYLIDPNIVEAQLLEASKGNLDKFHKLIQEQEEAKKFLNDLKTNPIKVLSDLNISHDIIKEIHGKSATKKSQARRISSTTSKTLKKGTQKKRSRNKKITKRTRVRSK